MKTRITASLLPPFLLLILISGASAQVQRTFVSGLGSDSNPCTRAVPCRNFARAISQTSAGGEVVVLDSAGYGQFAINKAVSITAMPGVYAGISVFSGDGIDINAGASDTVILRGLNINSQGTNGSGIVFTTGGTLHIEGCVISGFGLFGDGVLFEAAARLEVKDSIMRGNGVGIDVRPVSGSALAAVDRVRLERNDSSGLKAEDGAIVTVRNSVASGNAVGFFVTSKNILAPAEMNIENCVAANNNSGIIAQGTLTASALARVSNCTVTNTFVGLDNSIGDGSVILSRGNNTVAGNIAADINGVIGVYSAK